MDKLRLFIDTHDQSKETFPAGLDARQLQGFLAGYAEACRQEGVVLLHVYAGLEAGRAFCLSLAADEAAVRRAHARVGLPFDSVTEVKSASPGDLYFQPAAA